MKTKTLPSSALLAGAVLIFAATIAEARPIYGVSGRHGYAVRGTRGAAVVGEDRAAVVTRRGFAATGPNGTVAARRPYAPVVPVVPVRPIVPVVPVRPIVPVVPVVPLLPAGYIRVIPAGYRTVVYRGYNCFFVGGIYYRAVIYGGETVYVVVT